VAPAAAVDEDDDEEEDNDNEEEDIGEVVVLQMVLPPLAPPDALPAATQLALVNKLREGAYEARRPSVENAIAMLKDGIGFTVTPYDFKEADAFWGPDIASMTGETTKSKAMVPDATLGVPVNQQEQILVVDIMYIDQVSTVVAVASRKL
jgi:hypothetical protein